MEEKLKDITVDLLLEGIGKTINQKKEDFEWKKLFLKTGDFFINDADKLKTFENDLFVVFSKENLKKLAEKLNGKRGYEFPELLHDELYNLMIQYEIPQLYIETYIHQFSQVIINYLGKNDFNKTLEMYLGQWKNQEEEYFNSIQVKLDLLLRKIAELKEVNISSFSISDIDLQIRKESKFKEMGLSFFELDDEQFEIGLQDSIEKETIYVVGKSREETIYRILNELRRKNLNRIVLVIKSEDEWKRLDKTELKGAILIPFFFAESIVAISNNTNIFVYSEGEPCYNREKLELRKRTKRNIIHSLEKIGMDSTVAYNIVDNTHGLYVPLKKKLFNGAMYSRPEWVQNHSDVIMTALLCGKWTDSDGDILIFEDLSGKNYNECKKELENYYYGENPFVVVNRGYIGNNMQLASVEDAWEELDFYISDKIWEKFIKLFYEVLIESEPIFEYPFEKHFEASIYASKPEWSPVLKSGMIRTLIMRAYYRGHIEYQNQIDNVVGNVLKTITNKERWGYISQYITDLCEASPNAVLEKLESEFENSTGMIQLFSENDGDFMTSRHYYTHILWAVEQLLQQKKYVARAVEWLWKMNLYEIKYNITNSPKSVLERVFCAWINLSVLSVDSKIDLAKRAIQTYDNAWEIIVSKLPNSGKSICSTVSLPKYRRVDEKEDLYRWQVDKTYIEYLYMCTNACKTNPLRWKKVMEHLHWYQQEIQDEILGKLVIACKMMNDSEKIQIKDEIRYLIYRHRYFVNSDWSMGAICSQKYEKTFFEIILEEPVFDFLYLFSPIYQFPLLNPVPYNQEDSECNSYEQNKILREYEIKEKLKNFKEQRYSLKLLIDLALQEEKCLLGEVLAQFYSEKIYEENVLELLLEKDKQGRQVYDYIRVLFVEQVIDLKLIIEKIKRITNNEDLIVDIISLQTIEEYECAIIKDEKESIKNKYWSRSLRIRLSKDVNENMCIWALNECYRYGTLNSFVELLFDLREKINPIFLYEYMLKIENMKNDNFDSMTDYYIKGILNIIQINFSNDIEKCQRIAMIEWLCRNILEWEEMICFQSIIKRDPVMYAWFVSIIYKSDNNNKSDKEKIDLGNKIYDGFEKAEFCPAENKGKVEYEEIKEWLEKFRELLLEQGQSKLWGTIVGRLLSFSPIDEDGYMPCKAVRRIIEENYSQDLKQSYVIAERNKRGVYITDAGKSERKLCEKYKDNAEALQYKYPYTASIYFELSNLYKSEADWERRRAEDTW